MFCVWELSEINNNDSRIEVLQINISLHHEVSTIYIYICVYGCIYHGGDNIVVPEIKESVRKYQRLEGWGSLKRKRNEKLKRYGQEKEEVIYMYYFKYFFFFNYY